MLSAPPPDPPQFPFAAVFAWLGDVLRDVVHAAKQSLARHGATYANDQHAAERTETIITPPAQRGDQPATRRGAGCIVVLAFGVAFISGFILRALGAFGPVPSIGTLAAGRIPTPIMESPGVVPTMTAFKPSNTPASAPPPTQVARPTATPIYAHRATPTPTATDTPTATVTAVPSVTITVTVTETPSVTPTDTPIEPTATPTTPTATPTATPTTPTATATDTPTDVATDTPTSASATATPTNTTQGQATATPTPTPTRTPRPTPTQTSTSPPSSTPSS